MTYSRTDLIASLYDKLHLHWEIAKVWGVLTSEAVVIALEDMIAAGVIPEKHMAEFENHLRAEKALSTEIQGEAA